MSNNFTGDLVMSPRFPVKKFTFGPFNPSFARNL